MKVLWTESAVAQLQAIHDYLAQTSPEYALRIVDRLTVRSIQIATYRIIYLIESEQQKVKVLAVIHAAREQLRPIG